MKKKKNKRWIIIGFTIICLIGVIYSSVNILIYKLSSDEQEEIKLEIKKSIIPLDDIKDNTEVQYKIDFDKLKEMNPDTVAYLKVLGTNIDYVIVKGKDNSYYLNYNFNKEYNVLGWPFADYRDRFDGSDKNIIIYGHNIKTGSMFGTLKNVLEKNWQENLDNRKITFITESEEAIFEVFSTYVIEPEIYYTTTNFNDDIEYQTFLNKINKRSNYDYKIDVNSSDTILTLSSCTNDGKKRVVLHAKKIYSEINKIT